ncbi:PAS domain S-box protein [uncultured Desulfobulbus sp.]|uniref:PAS domain S-box protein n=1 Tax=uncultured Desulfobulbus sp. TaxID=239745 RepID=UPI0029C7CF60|nr:PAS domain S-box protein [uncultured Desulfobulbus sp.]
MPPSPPSPATSGNQNYGRLPARALFALACLVIAAITAGGYGLYKQQEQTILREHGENLHAIAQLKTNQILAWRQERLADARMHSSGMVRVLSQQWLQSPRPALLEEVRQRLQFFQENEGYANMMLADSTGRIQLSLLPRITELEPEEQHLVSQVVASKQVVLGDFFHCRNCNQSHLEVAAPIFNGDQVSLVLLLVADPERDLYPMIQTWPIVHRNAESMLVRKEGDHALFLNQLRHQPSPALSFRLPLTQNNAPSVQAVLGITGMIRGVDYRGVDVLASANAVPETHWYIVTKMDSDEILAEARYRAGAILLLVTMATVIAGILVQFTSLARRKALSEALLQEEREHRQTRGENRATLYSIGEGVIATDTRGLVTRMNPVAESLTGWREAEALGNPLAMVYQVIDEDSCTSVELPVERVLRDGEIVGMSNHTLLIAQDGSCRPIADSAAPIRSEAGLITGVVLVFRDQSKRRAIEKARAESAKRYTDLVESISDFIWETGPDHRYSFASGRSIDMLGYTPEEFVGKSWFDILDREDESTESVAHFQAILTNRQPYSQLCRTFVKKDGGEVVLESSATPIFDPQGTFLGYRGVSRDITERKRAEDEQKKLEAQLLQSQKMEVVGRLAGGVAHDFNNMLTIIGSYVEMTLNELNEEHPLYKRLREVHQAALHSADLTRQLLAFARKQVISPRLLDLNETITNALKMLHRLIGENIELVWKPGSNPGQVLIDPTQLGQILANLAVNARDAINGNGRLVITTSTVAIKEKNGRPRLDLAPGRYVLITITDDGCGMDEVTMSRIFEPFFTTKEEGKGTGLGLATVYGILMQNEGAVTVSSAPNQGTTINLYLPQAQVSHLILQENSEKTQDIGTETILLVEDETAILELGIYILEQQGYKVLVAPTPTKALTLVEENREVIDLLITDVIMPEMNGKELARRIEMIRPGIRVLFISGYTADIISPHGILSPDIHFLEKPFSARSLRKKVREVLLDHR